MDLGSVLHWIETQATREDLAKIATAYKYRADGLNRMATQDFRVGDKVGFWASKRGRNVHGVVEKVNQKNLKVRERGAPRDTVWTVSASICQHEITFTKVEG